jgi:hypothetical protein
MNARRQVQEAGVDRHFVLPAIACCYCLLPPAFCSTASCLLPTATWLFVVGWNHQVLSDLDLVRIIQLVPVGIENSHVLVGIAVVLLADF